MKNQVNDALKREAYYTLSKETCDCILTAKGDFRVIEHMSHQWYLKKLIEEEYNIDAKDDFLKDRNKEVSETWFESWACSKYGYISIHTSGDTLLWIQLPRQKVSQEKLDILKTEYAKGSKVGLVIKALEWFNENFDEYDKDFGEYYKQRGSCYQIQVEINLEKTERYEVTF